MDLFYRLLVAFLWPWAASWYRWHFRGIEHIPRSGGVVLASNHISYLDPIVLGYAGLKRGRALRFLAKSELFEKRGLLGRFLAWGLTALGQVPVRRGTREAAASLRAAEKAISAGECLAIFPEGTISMDTFEPMEPRTGVGRLAVETAAPVVPVAIWGSQRVVTKGRKPSWRPGYDLFVVVGAPLYAEPGEDAGAVSRRVMACIRSLLDEAILEYPVVPAPGDDWWLQARDRAA